MPEQETCEFQFQMDIWKSEFLVFKKRPSKSSKNKLLVSGLHSTSDDQLSNLNNKSWQQCTTKVPQNDLEWPISPNSQLFQSFPNKVAQDNSEWLILPDAQLFQSFPTKVAQNDSEWPILHGKKKKKNTMIQGNFYERLHFYMDSCAISPTASLLTLWSCKWCDYWCRKNREVPNFITRNFTCTKLQACNSCIGYLFFIEFK